LDERETVCRDTLNRLTEHLFGIAKSVEALCDTRIPWISLSAHRGVHRLLDDPLLRVFSTYVQEGQVVVDVGANRGTYTADFADLVGKSGLVIAIEPLQEKVDSLLRTVGQQDNVRVMNLGCSDKTGERTLYIPTRRGHPEHSLATFEHSGVTGQTLTVKTARLDDLQLTKPISLLKVDVEGHELSVFRGALETLERDRPVLVAEIDQRQNCEPIEKVFELLQSHGYQAYAIAKDGVVPLAQFDKQRHQLDLPPALIGVARRHIVDFLFLPDRQP
jgi:FkbM family methyltransferase